jgi:hypothetical protein
MSLPRPAPSHHPDSLSSLTNEKAAEPIRPSYQPFQARAAWRHTTGGLRRGMNRQSMLIFADFNNFESPRNSREYPNRRGDNDDNQFDPDFGPDFNPDLKAAPPGDDYSVEKNLPDPPYHIFTLAKKKQLVYIVSLAGLFSPLSSNIYFPALGQISRVISRS